MANGEHLQILRRGVAAWDKWRWGNIDTRPDLSGASLRGQDLRGVDLGNANLRGANLNEAELGGANLHEADLSEANLGSAKLASATLSGADLSGATLHRATLQRANLYRASATGGDLSEADLSGARLIGADLRNVDLRGALLTDADLRDARLSDADLEGADLVDAYLSRANLVGAYLNGADLSGADLSNADLRGADLRGVDLSAARLSFTNLYSANLSGADLADAELAYTVLANLDLGEVDGLDSCKHLARSAIDSSTLMMSGKLPLAFLRGCGMSDLEIEATGFYHAGSEAERTAIMKTVFELQRDHPVKYHAVFIGHSSADREFAGTLHDTLQQRGIRCWLDEKQILPGDEVVDVGERGTKLWDKLILCCSEAALRNSWWIETEIDRSLQTEGEIQRREGQASLALIPLDLDGYVSQGWKNSRKSEVLSRDVADFTAWHKGEPLPEGSLDRLVKALRVDESPG
jgi:uncharacterized protein YjbI with pentapeptide repeats